ncbi:MAG: lyase family protein [Acidobacteriota bacterium]
MTRLWDRGQRIDERIHRFTVGRDPELDLRLVPYDALASAAHAAGLVSIGLLSEGDFQALRRELAAIADDVRAGRFAITGDEEDGHTAIENRLVARLGDAGKRIHTGRSRNDQVIAATRLFGREALLDQMDTLLTLTDRLVALAERHREVSVPGYTHARQAVPSTLGFLFVAHAEGLAAAVPWLRTAFEHLDRSPLGSAAGYGVPLPLAREDVARRLAFGEVQGNTLAVQNERGKTEFLVLGAILGPVLDLGRLAADLIWFASDELRYLRLDESVTTGSSIMPQKRNPDVLELVRAGSARLRARQAEVAAVVGPLVSGYHRDLQLTKEPFLEGMVGAGDLLAAMLPVLETLTVDEERCRAAFQRSIGATDEVFRRVGRGEPFRSAYQAVAQDPEGAVDGDPAESWRLRTHLGAPGALDPAPVRRQVEQARRWLAETGERVAGAWRLLAEPAEVGSE